MLLSPTDRRTNATGTCDPSPATDNEVKEGPVEGVRQPAHLDETRGGIGEEGHDDQPSECCRENAASLLPCLDTGALPGGSGSSSTPSLRTKVSVFVPPTFPDPWRRKPSDPGPPRNRNAVMLGRKKWVIAARPSFLLPYRNDTRRPRCPRTGPGCCAGRPGRPRSGTGGLEPVTGRSGHLIGMEDAREVVVTVVELYPPDVYLAGAERRMVAGLDPARRPDGGGGRHCGLVRAPTA